MKLDLYTVKIGDQDKLTFNFTVNHNPINYYGDVLKVIEPIEIIGTVYNVGNKIFLNCSIETDLEVNCGRCLKSFTYPLKTKMDVELIQEDEVQEEDYSDDIITYKDNTIDFSEIAKEQIITSIPMKVVCSKDCKGLCEACGTDLNIEPCRCNTNKDRDIDPRLAKLKELLQQD
ncbi:YceD family protein [Natronincola ferrireducens]|uniref:DUF177 domain-containing protein n=1 Tax=Natronincola ferrireducens TaxID=393762 RepID=A0A1G9BWA2_9FIRM|nr:DUF177 domain-containing protein [Natronincola ferrireducens]SDK43719.1 uncharacterized protein SAMN05660472_01289 [Natronincola ferrireducens]